MAYMEWDGTLSVGNMMVDDDHRTLVACINDLFDAGKDDRTAVDHVLDVLGTYTHDHFAREEELMATHGFPDIAAHKKEHALLLKLYLEHRQQLVSGEEKREDILKFLKMWLVGHIKQSDLKYGAYLREEAAKVADDLPDEQVARAVAMANAAEKAPPSAHKVDWSMVKVAIIDDATDLRRILRAMLRGFGTVQIDDFADAASFLSCPDAERTAYNVLLIDDDMSPINGIELMYRIRTHPDMPYHRAVAIMMAGDANVSTIRASLDSGFHGVVAKPFSANAIRLQAERFLANPLPWEKDGQLIRPIHPKKAAAPR